MSEIILDANCRPAHLVKVQELANIRKGDAMKLNTRAAALTFGLIWGGSVMAVAVTNIFRPQYGKRFLRMIASIYPGFHAEGTAKDALVGTAYAVADGAVGGVIVAALYNRLAAEEPRRRPTSKAA